MHPAGPVEVGFLQAEYRVPEGSGRLTVPFQIFNLDQTTWPAHAYVVLSVSFVDGTAMSMSDE